MDSENRMVAYLLRELPEDEQVKVEQEYLTGDAAYEQLLLAEDELAYEYVLERLSPARRRQYETTIGATERGRKNVEFARSLLDALRATRPRAVQPGRYWALAIAAGLALAVLPVWQNSRVRDLRAQMEQLRALRPFAEAGV